MLQISCTPGGARKEDYYIFNTLDEVKRTLCEDICDVYMTFVYEEDSLARRQALLGATLFLYVVENNKLITKIDLNPYISLLIDDVYSATFIDGSFKIEKLFYGPFNEEDQDDDFEILSELFSCNYSDNCRISEDYRRIIMNAELNYDSWNVPDQIKRDNYTIHIDIQWPEIPIIQGNITEEISVPEIWIDSDSRETDEHNYNYGYNSRE